jgi:hypothetical protein
MFVCQNGKKQKKLQTLCGRGNTFRQFKMMDWNFDLRVQDRLSPFGLDFIEAASAESEGLSNQLIKIY